MSIDFKHSNADGVVSYFTDLNRYFTGNLLNIYDDFETGDFTGKQLGYDDNDIYRIIYPVNKNKGHQYFHLANDLKPSIIKKDGKDVRCCNVCYKTIRPRKDDLKNYKNRMRCLSCWDDANRIVKTKIVKVTA